MVPPAAPLECGVGGTGGPRPLREVDTTTKDAQPRGAYSARGVWLSFPE